jgi:hypothetical protein
MLLGQAAGPHPASPPQLVAAAIVLPTGSTLTGQPLSLLAALESTADRRQQLEIVGAYWQLVQAVAEYHFCLDHVQALAQVKARGNEDASLRSGQASAAALLRDAELDAVRAQHTLAGLVRLPAGAPLPLPADHPTVGAYLTRFNELFAGRTPPESARLAEKILPLERQAIDDQAAAVQAAEDALTAVADDYQRGRSDAAAVVACSGQLLRQQRAFIRAVYRYNHQIADYGLMVVGPTATPQTLSMVLIGPVQQASASAALGDGRSVQSAGATEPITTNPAGQSARNEPTLAPPRSTNEPTLAPPRDGWKGNEPTPAPPREGLKRVGPNEPTLAPPRDPALRVPADAPEPRLVPVEPEPPSPARSPSSPPQPRTTNKPVESSSFAPQYPALVNASADVQAKQLATAIFWDRSLPAGSGSPISLADCLLRDAGSDRQATIDAYWLVRQRAAQYQLFIEEAEFFSAIFPVALEHRGEPSGAADMLQLQVAQLAAKAAADDALAALVEAQYALALRIGAVADATWPLASTVPHSGSYLLKLEVQPPNVVQSWPVRRLAATVPELGESVRQHATAVVEADAARSDAAEKYRLGAATISQTLESIAAQSEQTMAFVNSLTAYNRAIAEYALTVLPPGTPADKLVAALVIKP